MAKFKARVRDCRLFVKIKLSFKERLNERQLQIFSGKYIRGMLKVEQIKKHTVEYSGPMGISLCDRLKKPVSKNDFFFLMEQIVDVVQKLNQNSLIVNSVVFELNHVFINETTRELQFVYLPLDDVTKKADIIRFIESIVYSAQPLEGQETEYISKFIYFIKSIERFDTEKIEKYILKEDRSVVDIIKRNGMGQSGFMTDKPADYFRHYQDERGSEETGLLKDEETGKLSQEDEVETGLLNDWELDGFQEDEPTGLLEESCRQVHYATLYRVLTDEEISICKPVFRIGKERSYSDYFVSNNDKVSRSHADIITRGQQYYIRDLDSTNHTYINGQVVPAQQEMELYDGDQIRLANEEFEFHI